MAERDRNRRLIPLQTWRDRREDSIELRAPGRGCVSGVLAKRFTDGESPGWNSAIPPGLGVIRLHELEGIWRGTYYVRVYRAPAVTSRCAHPNPSYMLCMYKW